MSIPTAPAALNFQTTYADLNEDQRRRFGRSILARDAMRREAAARAALAERARKAMEAAGGDKGKALLAMIAHEQ